MNLNSALGSVSLVLRRRPVMVALTGLVTILLTPFVFFPEIMGDAGVTHASALRNASALAFLFAGGLVMFLGFGTLGWRLTTRRKKPSTRP